MELPTVSWVLLHQLAIKRKKKQLWHVYRPIWSSHLFKWGFISQVTLGYIKLQAEAKALSVYNCCRIKNALQFHAPSVILSQSTSSSSNAHFLSTSSSSIFFLSLGWGGVRIDDPFMVENSTPCFWTFTSYKSLKLPLSVWSRSAFIYLFI